MSLRVETDRSPLPATGASACLDLFEALDGQLPAVQARILATAFVGGSDGASTQALGERNRRLLELLEDARTTLRAEASCPACDERLEVTIAPRDLLVPRNASAEAWVACGGVRLRVRRLTTGEVAELAERFAPASDRRGLRKALAEAALVEAVSEEGDPVTSALTDDAVDAIGHALEDLDPQSDLRVRTACPACGHSCSYALDPTPFVAERIAAEATQLFDAVHRLARAYGWTEADVLRLGATRRRRYLDRCGA